MEKKINKGSLKSLYDGLQVLQVVADTGDRISVREVSQLTGIKESTIGKILNVFQQYDYVRMVPGTKEYGLSFKILEHSERLLDTIDVRRIAMSFVQRFAEEIGESTGITLYQNGDMVYVARFELPRIIRIRSKVGSKASYHCTSSGKVALAFLPQEDAEAVWNKIELNSRTSKTITDIEVLRREIERVREIGYAITHEESIEGIVGIGAPLFDHQGIFVGAVSVSCLSSTTDDDRVVEIGEKLVVLSKEISHSLGNSKVY